MTDFVNLKIGDTPTIGAGFWAEEWSESSRKNNTSQSQNPSPTQIPTALSGFADGLRNVMGDCIPKIPGYHRLPSMQELGLEKVEHLNTIRAVAMSGSSKIPLSASLIEAITQQPKTRIQVHRYRTKLELESLLTCLLRYRQRRLLPPPFRRPYRRRHRSLLPKPQSRIRSPSGGGCRGGTAAVGWGPLG